MYLLKFYFIEFISQKNYQENLKLTNNQNLTDHENIINSFIDNSQPYFKYLFYARTFGLLTLIIILISFFISIRNVFLNKSEKIDVFNLFVFYLYEHNFHTRKYCSISIKMVFSYFPLAMISSTILLDKLINLYINKK